jgi:hypothetical protein
VQTLRASTESAAAANAAAIKASTLANHEMRREFGQHNTPAPAPAPIPAPSAPTPLATHASSTFAGVTFGGGPPQGLSQPAQQVEREDWPGTTGPISVDPRDPPPFAHRHYGIAGWPPVLPDHIPTAAPTGTLSMHDTMRTTGDGLSTTEPAQKDRLFQYRHRISHVQFPQRPAIGDRVLMAQTRPSTHITASKPPVTYPKLQSCALASYTVEAMDNDPHGLLTLANPLVIGGPIDTRWLPDLQIPTPSVFLPSMTVIQPRSHNSGEQGQGRAHGHHSDAGSGSANHHRGDDDDGGRRKSSKRSKKDKHDCKRDKRQRREGQGAGDAGDDDKSSSSSDDSYPDVRKITDPAGNEVLNSKSKVTMTVRRSQPYQAFTTQAMRDATFLEPGNELQNYNAHNFVEGATNLYIRNQASDTPGARDPGIYSQPAFQLLHWHSLIKSNPTQVMKMIYFAYDLSRNWNENSFRMSSFLSSVRTAAILSGTSELSRQDWVDALYGMADTYGLFYCTSFQRAFQHIANMIAREQAGRDYPYPYLESTFNDMLYYIMDAARNPNTKVTLPGQITTCTPKDLTPDEWAEAITQGFAALLISYRNVGLYQNFVFHRSNQPPFPPSLTPTKPKGPKLDLIPPATPNKQQPPGIAPGKPTPRGWCATDIMRHYKVVLKSGLPLRKCPAGCLRVHVRNMKAAPRAEIVACAARFCKPQLTPDDYGKLEAAIKEDKRYS